MRTVLIAVAALITVFGAVPSKESAAVVTIKQPRSLPFCADFIYAGCTFGDHKLQGPSGAGYDGDEAHGDCRSCVPPLPCHTDCGVSEENESVQKAYKDAVAAAARGDAARLLTLQDTIADYVQVNEERNSIQVLSCDRSRVIANLSVEDRLR